MKIIIEKKIWSEDTLFHYIYLTNEYDLIGSLIINIENGNDDSIVMADFYIQPEFRCKGYDKIMMNDIINNYGDKIIFIFTLKKNYIFEYYKQYGFKLSSKHANAKFRWMKRKRSK